MKNYTLLKLLLISLIINIVSIKINAQQLVQSFIEVNSVGNSRFGVSVSSAGDVNGDGYSDVIVGADAYNYAYSVGRAYIFFGAADTSMDEVASVIMTGEEPNSRFGMAVSSAGDVNNDGYDDVIVGAFEYNSHTGKVYVFFGSAGSTMDGTADVTMTGEGTSNNFGWSVSSAGDVNGDGYDDVIVGANIYNSYTGRAYVYFGSAGSTMDGISDVIMTGEGTDNFFGCSVSGTGDVNNDGYDDVIVGAYRYNSYTGKSYIYFGSTGTTMDGTADVTMTGEDTYNYFGYSVSNAGDVNNDGYDDVIVGAYRYNLSIGRSYIYFGSAGTTMDGTADVIMTGEGTGDFFGYSATAAGDVNNDGYDDVIIGAYQYNSYNGRSYIYFGSVGTTMDGTADVIMTGEGTDNYFGYSVSDAGDVNNDRYDDVIVGAYPYNSHTGRSYIYFGSAGTTMDGTADVIMTGESTYNQFGYSVSSAGDVNNDGYDDVIVGAPGYNSQTGKVYIYFGSAGTTMDGTADVTMTGEGTTNNFGCSVSSAGDVNGDGYDDVVVGAHVYNSYTGRAYVYFGASGTTMDGTADVTMTGEGISNHFGNSVSCAGDVNNDGYKDVIVGAYTYNSQTGKVYIYFGSVGTTMDGTADVIMTGEGTDNYFGYSVSGTGDVNNDGYDDVIVGAYRYNSYTGKSYIYFGSVGTTMDGTADVIMTGEGTLDFFGYSVSGTGDVNNDGYDDVIVGAYCYNSYTGKSYIYFGSAGTTMDGTADITISGEGINNNFGYSVSGAGDVNNDGYDDVIVGANKCLVNGKAYIYSDDSAPLPVKLTSFYASLINNEILLTWQTATEVNNYGFQVQRQKEKEQSEEWETIGFVEGNGTTNSPKSYSYTDSDLPDANEVSYRLKQIDNDGTVSYSKIITVDLSSVTDVGEDKIKYEFSLQQNYPNPFNPSTTIKFTIPNVGITQYFSTATKLIIYDILGREIKTLVNKPMQPGIYKVEFNAGTLPSGIYFYKLQSGKQVQTQKMVLLR